jgi:hypothetical protein
MGPSDQGRPPQADEFLGEAVARLAPQIVAFSVDREQKRGRLLFRPSRRH